MKLLLAFLILHTAAGQQTLTITDNNQQIASSATFDWSSAYTYTGTSVKVTDDYSGFSYVYVKTTEVDASGLGGEDSWYTADSGNIDFGAGDGLKYFVVKYGGSGTTFSIFKWQKEAAPCTSEKNAYRDGKCCPNDSKDGCAALKTAYENCVAGTTCEAAPAGQCVPRDEWLGDGRIHYAMGVLNCFTLGDQQSCEAARVTCPDAETCVQPDQNNLYMGLSGDGQYCMWNTGVSAGCTESTPTAEYCKSDSDAKLGKILSNYNSGFGSLQEFCQSLDADTCNVYSMNHGGDGGYATAGNACCEEP